MLQESKREEKKQKTTTKAISLVPLPGRGGASDRVFIPTPPLCRSGIRLWTDTPPTTTPTTVEFVSRVRRAADRRALAVRRRCTDGARPRHRSFRGARHVTRLLACDALQGYGLEIKK